MAVSVHSVCDVNIHPNNDEDMLVEEMIGNLCRKGYCVSDMPRPDCEVAELLEAANRLRYEPVPEEFEPYYLGRDSSNAKTTLLDFEAGGVPESVLQPFAAEDAQMTDLCAMLGPSLEEELGIRIQTRTNLLVRQTFNDIAEDNSFPLAARPSGKEREAFMGLMKRKRVCVMQFIGPLTSHVTLTSKEDGKETRISAAPGTMVMFLAEQFSYSHQVSESGATLVLQCWFLARAPQFQMLDIGGDMDVIAVAPKGSPLPQGDQVSIAGIATMMGGDAKDPTCFWLVVNKGCVDTCHQFPIKRFDWTLYVSDEDQQTAMTSGKSYTKHQGYVDGIEYFDGNLFGVSNAEARSMDPNQRKCLETAYSSMYMAGHEMKQLKSKASAIGAFVGISGSEWGLVPHEADTAGCGTAEAIIGNRLNFVLNLKGPSVTSNTACSAGLTAINIGKLWLKYRDYDPLEASLGGGIQLAYSPFIFASCCGGGMLSFQGRCFTFDKTADGYLRGEGSTFIYMAMKPYNDDVLCLNSGGQSNQDGRSASITAPNGPSQEKCIRAALREAGVGASEVDCFECHGTGTALGDPIEVGAFKRIYTQSPRDYALLVCTSKTNFGHSEGGAGSCGFVKCCLQVMRCEASPGLHLRERNAHIDVEGFPAFFLSEPVVTHHNTASCGVSSFGFGGTNGHAIAYAENRTTSRDVNFIDYRGTMLRKIETATAPQIIMPSEDPGEWESTGMPVGEVVAPKHYQIELNADGRTIWREIVPDLPSSFGCKFHLSGSFNFWDFTPMEEDLMTPGLFTAELRIGKDGIEYFYIVCDDDQNSAYFPDYSQGFAKSAPVVGPDVPPADREDNSWCIQDEEGVSYIVEFYRTDYIRTVSWKRLP